MKETSEYLYFIYYKGNDSVLELCKGEERGLEFFFYFLFNRTAVAMFHIQKVYCHNFQNIGGIVGAWLFYKGL